MNSVAEKSEVHESPSSPEVVGGGSSYTEANVIPVYSVSDSDEDRMNNLVKSVNLELSQRAQSSHECKSPDTDVTNAAPIQVVDLSEELSVEETPAVQILFMNTDIGRKYRHDIEEFFHTLMTTEALSKDKEPLPKIQTRPNLKSADGEVLESGVVPEATVIGTVSVYRSYMVDRHGWPMIANMLNQTAGISIPDYTQDFPETYPPPEDAKILEERPIKTSKKCFNCGGDGHEMKQCPKPFDKRTFNKNRAKFRATGLQYGRYHKEEKNKKFRPGELTSALRTSLGLADNDLPQHIYRMRQLGYPPGWLLYAEATNSGLAMFDKIGKEVDLDGDIMEDGEVPAHRIRDEENLKYNSDDLITYPGFNAVCPEGVIDNAVSRRDYPSMRSEHNLEHMSSNINVIHDENDDKSLKRTRYDSTSHDPKRRKSNHVDMDLSDGEDDGIIEIPSKPTIDVDEASDDDIREFQVIDELPAGGDDGVSVTNINATLTALEEHKQKLLAELSEMSSSTPVQAGTSASYDAMTKPPLLELEDEENEETQNISQPSYQSMSYLVSTPVLQHSGIDKLPAYEKFSDGITEHLFFENLPNSTGVYEKMSGILKGVKQEMAVIRPKRNSKK